MGEIVETAEKPQRNHRERHFEKPTGHTSKNYIFEQPTHEDAKSYNL